VTQYTLEGLRKERELILRQLAGTGHYCGPSAVREQIRLNGMLEIVNKRMEEAVCETE